MPKFIDQSGVQYYHSQIKDRLMPDDFVFTLNYTQSSNSFTTTLTPEQFGAAVEAKKRLFAHIPQFFNDDIYIQVFAMYVDDYEYTYKPVMAPIAERQISVEFYFNDTNASNEEYHDMDAPYTVVARRIICSTPNMNYDNAIEVLEVLSTSPSDYITAGVNLLHNADWGYSLINQREHSGTVAANAYCIDRWYNGRNNANYSVTPNLQSGYVELSSGMMLNQRMEILPETLLGKTVTFAYENAGGQVYYDTLTFPSTLSGSPTSKMVNKLYVGLGFETLNSAKKICGQDRTVVPYISIIAYYNAVRVQRVWLEYGTMCHMQTTPPKEYSENLLTCQRYFVRHHIENYGHYCTCATTTVGSSVAFVLATVLLPTTMRDIPRLTHTYTHADTPTGRDVVMGTGDETPCRVMSPTDNTSQGYEIVSLVAGGVLLKVYIAKFNSIADDAVATRSVFVKKGINLLCQPNDRFDYSADL